MVGTILGVLWLILKIILWVLLVVIGIVLLLILMVLFVPIRYRVKGDKYASIHGSGKVTYLLRLIRASFHYTPEGYGYKVKVLFFTILNEEVPLDNKAVDKPIEAEAPIETAYQAVTPINIGASSVVGTDQSLTTPVVDVPKVEAKPQVSQVKPQEEATATRPEVEGPAKPKEKPSKKKKKVKKKKEASKTEKEGESKKDQVLRFYGFLREERNVGVLRFILKKLFKAIGSILPKKFRGNIHFGLDDPAMTAYILGGASIFYPKYKDSLTLTANFETPMIEGDLDVRGYILPCIFLWALIKIYVDKRVRRLIKEVRKKPEKL